MLVLPTPAKLTGTTPRVSASLQGMKPASFTGWLFSAASAFSNQPPPMDL